MALFGSLLGLPLASAPAGAVPVPLSLSLVDGGGTLVLRGSEEPAKLASPTTLQGTVQDTNGVLSAGTFATPPVSYQFAITTPLVATVFVDAVFSEVASGTVTGAVGEDDNVTVDMVLEADLHIEVGSPAVLQADCTTTPVPLRLTSTAPYDRDGTKRVTLRDADFSVPAVPVTPDCPAVIANGVNERLAGSGHSLELVMEGEVPEVLGAGENTVTTLSTDVSVTRAGQPVTLSAAIVQADGGPEAPTGLVEFRDGSTVVGSAPLDATAHASVVLTDLAVGEHTLTARYVGDGELYRSSVSGPVSHLVAAAPTVEVSTREAAHIGGAFVPATVTISNPEEFGNDIVNGRLDVTLARTTGVGQLTPDRVVIEGLNGATWEPVTLAPVTTSSVTGSVGLATGFQLDAGTDTEVRLRLKVLTGGTDPTITNTCDAVNPTCPGPVKLVATFVEVDPGNGDIRETLATDEASFMLVEGVRRAPTIAIVGGAPRPHTVRAGYTIEVIGSTGPNLAGLRPTGAVQFYVDGRLTPARRLVDPFGEYTAEVPIGTSIQGLILLPPDIDPGPHTITLRYLGDQVFLPAEVTTTFTVLPSSGHPFVCQSPALNAQHEFGANITFDADLPAVAVDGATAALDISEVSIDMNRPGTANPWPGLPNNVLVNVGQPQLERIAFGFGEAGEGAATSVTRTAATALPPSPNPAGEAQVDQSLVFGGATGSVTIEGEPGDSVPVILDEIAVDLNLISPPVRLEVRCTPVDGDPLELGEVEVAGTTVSATPSPAREITDEVTIEADTHPSGAAGTVTFTSSLDGDLGTDAVAGGSASIATDELTPGDHVITASFDAADPDVPDTVGTATVEVTYSPRTDTEAFVVAARTDFLGSADRADVIADAEDLDGGLSKVAYLRQLSRSDGYLARVVEDLYQDTLGRSADDAGRAFWIDRLRGGWSVARVTASFYGSVEYFARAGGTAGTWIDDLYGRLLGRSSDTGGRAFWVGEVDRAGRGAVALRFFQSRESARARVVALYELFLGRVPSPADQDFWATRVITQGDLALAVSLTVSTEYAERAEIRFPLV